MARKTAAEKAAGRADRGHNLPKREDMDAFLDRLHEVNDRLDEDSATHRGDMNSIYEEMASALDMPKEVAAAVYKADRRERKAAKKAAKADQRTRQAYEHVAQAYGSESPLGQWALRMAKASGAATAGDAAEDAETDKPEGEGGE